MKKPLIAILAFIGVFICGAVVGGAVTIRFGKQVVQKKAADQIGLQQWRRLADQLELSPEQREKLRPLIGRAAQDRAQALRQIQVINDRVLADVDALLTPEQKAKFGELRSRQRDSEKVWQKWVREQRSRRGDMPPIPFDGLPPPPKEKDKDK